MKKFLKLFLAVCASLCVFTACDKPTQKTEQPTGQVEATVKSIAVDASSVPAEIVQGQAEAEIAKIKLVVTMSDGSTQKVNVTKDMISAKDLEKLADLGTYNIEISYQGQKVEVKLVVVEEEVIIELTDISLTVEQAEIEVAYGAQISPLDGVKALGNDGISYGSKLTCVITNSQGQTVEKVDTQVENEVYTVVISINYGGISKSVTKKITVGEKPDTSGNLIPTGSFVANSDAYEGWDKYIADGGSAVLETETINGQSYAKVVQESCASTAYGIRLNNNSSNYFTLYNGQAYQVSFYAKASAAKKIQCQVGQLVGGAPYFYDFAGQMFKIDLTTEMQLFTFTFVASNPAGGELSASSVTFEMGTVDGDNTAATIWLGEVNVCEFSGEVADQIAPVITASNKTIYIGEYETVDLNEFVTVNDAVDGVVTPTYLIADKDGNAVNSINGTVPGVYTVDITAVDAAGNESTAQIVITVKERNTASQIKLDLVDGDIPNAGEDTLANDTLSYWNDQNWCGSTVTMVKNEIVDGVATIQYTGVGTCAFGLQVFHRNTALDEGSTYILKLKLNVETAVTATINGVVVDLVAGDNDVAVQYVEGNGVSSIDMQFPITDGCANTIKMSNIVWEAEGGKIKFDLVDGDVPNAGEDTLVNDTLSYWNDQNWCGSTVTMVQNQIANGVATFEYTGVGACTWGFQVFLRNSALDSGIKYTLTFKVNVSNAITAAINGVSVDLVAGDNNVSVEYVEGNGMSSIDIQFPITDGCSNVIKMSDIAWTEAAEEETPEVPAGPATESATFELADAQLSFAEEAGLTAGQIGYWADGNWCGSLVTINAANITNKEILIDYSATGACTFGLQLFYKDATLTANQKYRLTMTITVNSAITININNQSVELVAGVNNVTVDYVEGLQVEGGGATSSLDIQVPVDNNANVIKFGNIAWEIIVE